MQKVESDRPNFYQRVVDTITGCNPDRPAFIDRLELWYSCHSRGRTMPDEFQKIAGPGTNTTENNIMSLFTVPVSEDLGILPLTEVHRRIGMGQQLQMILHARRLIGVELILYLNGDPYYREVDPIVEYFPRLFDKIHRDKPGETVAEFITPKGTLTTHTVFSPENLAQGTVPIMNVHPVKGPDDYPAIEYIFKNSEFIPQYSSVLNTQDSLGQDGFVIPMLNRIPFQQLVLDHIGEVSFFYMMYDHPEFIEKMLNLLDEIMLEDIHQISNYNGIYVQFDDNLDGFITNPRLFKKYCLPSYHHYIQILHNQGKKVGSHTDGNLKPLLALLTESGLDVCESFSPDPLTECTFDEAWNMWKERGPIIWGGIPSPILDPETDEADFSVFIDHILHRAKETPMILGIGDLVMPSNLIYRLRYIANCVEELEL